MTAPNVERYREVIRTLKYQKAVLRHSPRKAISPSTRSRAIGRIQHASLWYLIAVAVVGSALTLAPIGSRAHIVPEQPWHPVAAAYLRSLFYLELVPIDWDLVASEYESVRESGYGIDSVYDGIAAANVVAGIDHATAIRAAIDNRDPIRLYNDATRAVSQLIRMHLNTAEGQLDRPGAAQDQVLRAQALYRAFDSGISQTDPEAYAHLGRTWLAAATSVGVAGIGRVGGVEGNASAFRQARAELERYLTINFESNNGARRSTFPPVPLPALRKGVVPRLSVALPPGTNLNDQVPLPRLVLNFEERGIDETDLFLIAYGDMLFDSAVIFGSPARELGISCSTCHNRSDINRDLFIPGISVRPGGADVDGHFFNPRFNDRRADALDTPSLRGIRFTAPYGRDGRFSSLREFTRNVIVNEFAGDEPTPFMLDALVSYLLEFDWLPNPLLRSDGSLTEEADPAALRGEKVFMRPFEGMSGLSCATCHNPTSNFRDGLQHDIASGTPASPGALDSAFDTPTLLNARFSAPYMHDGSIPTLEGVVEWFDFRFALSLSRSDKADLTAYLHAVGDGFDPFEVFDDDNTLFMLFWGELSTFISTLGTLIPERDRLHADLLIETVVPDLIADAGALEDTRQVSLVIDLADRLRAIQAAWKDDDWQKAEALWLEYQGVEAKYGPRFR